MTRHAESEAIVLDAQLAGEADRRVVLLCASGELVRGVAHAAARSRKRFGGALQPGARVRARWTVRREGAEAVLEEAQLVAEPPAGDPLERLYLAAHLLELAGAFAREGAEDPRLYRLLGACLEALAAGAAPDPLARYAEAWTLRLAGLLGDLTTCDECGAPLAGRRAQIAPESGAFCAGHSVPGARTLGPGATGWLAATVRLGPAAIPDPPNPVARELAQALPALVVAFTGRPLVAWPALSALRAERPRAVRRNPAAPGGKDRA
ncbi:MAG: DNA repair protein RecO [Acidobacteria bacterium]|jgi:DNA repair protein RecO (recombination protein O)|nr:DNA repair protein RecO [Acidobacteriota bacterium]